MPFNDPYYFRKLWIRLTNWEYWPFHVLYFPIYFYWAWLMLKSRAFFFFNTSNPLIENGGFLMESKKKIYDLLPAHFYPTTLFFEVGTHGHLVETARIEAGIQYPCIVKPDIGMRGMQVKLVTGVEELYNYCTQIKVNFLLQAYIPYTEEAGIFFCKMPGAETGTVTGIVGKEFLTVIGDGSSTIRTLILQNPRYLLQLPILEKTEPQLLNRVLSKGEANTLVPYGNHARGSRFVDWSDRIDEDFNSTMNSICKEIPEFYYGRIDVRFRDWGLLKQGKDFSIIEVNGAGSDPTHIYDPKHSVFFAWREIIRHLNLLYKISTLNKKQKGLAYMSFTEGMNMMRANGKQVQLISN